MSRARRLPRRDEVDPADTWDLSSLFVRDEDWERTFSRQESRIESYSRFRGRLGSSAETLARCLAFDTAFERTMDRLGTYAHLKSAEDTANSTYQRMLGRFRNAASRASQAAAYIRPEILAVPARPMKSFLSAPVLQPYRILLERVLRYKPYTLGEKEERLLAMQGEMAQAAEQIFRQLHNADLRFGTMTDERGRRVELSHATYMALLQSPSRRVRKEAFTRYYRQFSAHENSLAAALAGSIQRDVYYAKARGFKRALDAALFPDQVPAAVYENLIASVRRRLPVVHHYYDLRRRKLRLQRIHMYDTYVPMVRVLERRRGWNEAVELVVAALAPLGFEYTSVLERGLVGRWCDRYENRGKQSGAFSSGAYDGDPYILMNYESRVLDHVFTLAHEAGHSMHTYFSARSQPFQYYECAIFVAEVASTFNEQLLGRYLLDRAGDRRERAYLLCREIDSIRATLVRQTMFAEFEQRTHELVERNEPLTVERLKSVYRGLLADYFGPGFTLDTELALECLRIPHFHRAFYVYKYATGVSAAMALADRVVSGGDAELADYLGFLKAGCSKDPLDLLRDAGVDLARPDAVDAALARFERLLAELEELVE